MNNTRHLIKQKNGLIEKLSKFQSELKARQDRVKELENRLYKMSEIAKELIKGEYSGTYLYDEYMEEVDKLLNTTEDKEINKKYLI